MLEVFEGGFSGLCDHLVGMLSQASEGIQHCFPARISHRDGYISQESLVFCAPNRGMAEQLAEVVLLQSGKIGEIGGEEAGGEIGLPGEFETGAMVPRADVLADVTAEDVAAVLGGKVVRNGAALLNCEVGDA